MADLKFIDQHNMVACLERTEGNVDFHQIVDFLNASTIRTATTATSLEGTSSGSGPRCQDTTLGDADAQTRVLALETSKTAQDLVIKKLKKKVKSLEKKQRARTLGMKLFKIGDFDDDFDDIDNMVNEAMKNVKGDTVNVGGAVTTATTGVSAASALITNTSVSISTAEPRTPLTTTTTAFEDEDLNIAQTLVKMRSQNDKEKGKGVAFRAAQEESTRPTRILPTIDLKDKGKGIMQEPEKPLKNPRKAQIEMDEELAIILHKEEKVALERMQKDGAT
ncbi:hypothetical protein Tco_1195030 [Tanacetum coccineum]